MSALPLCQHAFGDSKVQASRGCRVRRHAQSRKPRHLPKDVRATTHYMTRAFNYFVSRQLYWLLSTEMGLSKLSAA